MTFPVLPANGPSGYNLTKSLRFRASANAYLNRTPASASNRKTWTWSAWVKRGQLGTADALFATRGNVTDAEYFRLAFGINNPDTIFVSSFNSTTIGLETTASFRDPSAWYHIVFVFDTTQATASNRMKLYVNGVQQTAFGIANYPSQNFDAGVNAAIDHGIGRIPLTSGVDFDGYMAEVNFIDGQALTPSSFGSTNPVTGVWQPAKYAGTYGTNGFYLPFTNATSTTTLGNDFSGNGNNWTTNNISLTSGATYDSMTDVPTLTSPTAANFAVLNPLSYRSSLSNTPPTNGNLTCTSDTNTRFFTSTLASSGSYYFEVTATTVAGGGVSIRLWGSGDPQGVSSSDFAAAYVSNTGEVYVGGTLFATVATYTSGDIVAFAHNTAAGTIGVYKNNVLQTTATGITTSSPVWPGCAVGASSVANINFGQRPFAYTPPSGFVALNTFNLPSSTIPNGANFMAADVYTGNGSSQTRTLNFQPDFIWNKIRSQAYDHNLFDVIRGVDKRLISNLTSQELTITNALTAFNSNGYSVGSYVSINGSGESIVNWAWKAGGAGVTNTAGSITSTVSANTTSGFSVVTYTANGTNGATVGHGLNVTPAIYIVKRRDTTGNWVVVPGNSSLFGGSFYLQLNTTSAVISNSDVFTSYPGSSVFYLSTNADVNASGGTYVAYCFAQIAGFSAVGSYAGNGSSDGPFIYTGFRPRWIMCKSSTDIGGWTIMDTSRVGYNANNSTLYAEATTVEQGYLPVDILSNGFKIRRIDTGTSFNSSGQTYIYAAFAENPFKNALAR